MKFPQLDEEQRVHVLDAHSNVWSVIREIAGSGQQEDAFYVCDIGDVIKKHRTWQQAMPRVAPYYAVKCNDSLIVLEVLAALGTGFDCASKGEINKILGLGVSPDRIIFANPAKPASHIRHAASLGVSLMTFDSEVELFKVKNMYPDARMVIRIRYDAAAQCPLGMKFGCDPVTEAPHLLKAARAIGVDVVGVSFHVGSGCRDVAAYRNAIAAARDVFDYAASLGFHFHLLDLGGGYPGDRGTSIDKVAEVINSSLDDYFPDPSVQVIAEPGRFYVSSAYTLACNVHSTRDILREDSTYHRMYYINDGVYGSFNCILYDHQRVVPQPLQIEVSAKYCSSSIWGPTCDGLDQVVDEVMLPEMKVGDWIVFEDMGAYTLPVASPFNGFPVSKVHIVADEAIWRLLKDIMPLSDEHFVIGNTPDNLRMGLGMDRSDSLPLPPLPIKLPIYNADGSILEEHYLELTDIPQTAF